MKKTVTRLTFCLLLIACLASCNPNQNSQGKTLPTDQKAEINDNNVSLRAIPSVDSQIVTTLMKSEEVTVLGKSKEKDSISGFQDFWYKLKTKEEEGWVFGQFLQVADPENIASIPTIKSAAFEKAAIEVWDDDPTEKRYHIIVWKGEYDFSKHVYDQDDANLLVADIAVATNHLKTGKYTGNYEAGFKTKPGKIIDSKVQEPVYIELTDTMLKIDTMGYIYEGGVHLTDILEALHFSGPFVWIGEKR